MLELLVSALGSAFGGFLGVVAYRSYLKKRKRSHCLFRNIAVQTRLTRGKKVKS